MSLYEWAGNVPWQIAPDALRLMLDLAQRHEVDADELKAAMHGPTALALRDGKPREDRREIVMHGPVARIAIDGPIFRYADYFTRYSGGITTEALAKNFQTAMDDPATQAILFVIDSPGGEATGINELANAIYAARSVKPSAAYVEGLGASAALRIAAATGQVIVDADAWMGSIGTVLGVTDPTKQIKRSIDFVSSQSPKKHADPTTPEGADYYQQLVDAMTENFIAMVMRDRGMTRDQVLALAGGMVIGQQAVAAGLADRIGSEDQLIQELAAQVANRRSFGMPGVLPVRREVSMQIFSIEWWKNAFTAQAELEGTPLTAQLEQTAGTRTVQISARDLMQIEQAAAPQQAQSGTDPKLTDRLAELEKEIAEQRTLSIQASAAAFADGAVRAHQALPAERQTLYQLYVQAATDDAGSTAKAFEGAAGQTRVAALEALVAQRPTHDLTSEQVATTLAGALPNVAVPETPSEERVQALLAMTPAGQAALDRRRARA